MFDGPGGSIINVSSLASLKPTPDTAPYAAAKAGLNAITVAFAHAYGPKVRVNCIVAGPFLTDAARFWSQSEEFNTRARREFALQRAGNPEEVVGTAIYLASDASSFTTGALIRVDGGVP
jgi:NAD(P)-dependent dehydrogenase (short-subunit alcohol dehydrogenase family)